MNADLASKRVPSATHVPTINMTIDVNMTNRENMPDDVASADPNDRVRANDTCQSIRDKES